MPKICNFCKIPGVGFFRSFYEAEKNGTCFLKKYFAVKILRKKNCGFTIIEILVVLSIIAALIGIAGKSLMPRNPLVDDDVLKIRDFIEKCVFECRTVSLRFFERFEYMDKIGRVVELFVPGIIYAGNSKPHDAKLYGKSSGGGTHVKYMVYEKYKLNQVFGDKLCFEFPKLRKKITDIKGGVFFKRTNTFGEYVGETAERDIDAGGWSIAKKGNKFAPDGWNIFFDGFFAILDKPCFDVDDKKGILCWEVTFDNKEKWRFYVDDLCICHSVRRK